MAVLSIEEIYDVARAAGFTPHQAVTWTAIAMAESGGRASALNDRGEHSVGLWQVNVAAGVRQNTYGNLNDPAVNARAAYEISHQGTDMRPWTTTHDANKGTAHDYRHYLPQVESLIGVRGDGRGVSGYGAPLPEPLTGAEYDQIDSGRPMPDGATTAAVTVATDTDQDGLTDEFEKLVGSSPTKIDTDQDGLSDSHEALISHTDPLSGDTDQDHLTDSAELIAGSDPGTIPGVGGVVGSGPLAINVRRPGRDTDQDGIPDRIERLVGLDPKSADTDQDQLPDAMEVSIGTDPTRADSDHDGVTDSFEVRAEQNPLAATGSTTNTVAAWTYESALAEQTAAQAPPNEEEPDSIPTGQSDALATFLRTARDQAGDSYVYGATPALSNADPASFDCSSLTQWAAHKAGIELPRIAEAQYMELKEKDSLMPVEEALKTPGALLFYFSEEPKGPLPAGQAHVAISLGDGRTIEAKGSAYGVGEFSAKGRFNYAGVIPGLSGQQATADLGLEPTMATAAEFDMDTGTALDPNLLPGADPDDPDHDQDGLTDSFEKLVGSDPRKVDTDSDGISDAQEAMVTHTDPLSDDTDQDQLLDAHELAVGSDPGRIPGIGGVQGTGRLAENVTVGHRDTDLDGVSDRIERILGTDIRSSDSDQDGLSDAMERAIGSNPLSADTDADGLTDSLEVRNRLNPLARNDLGPDDAGAGEPAEDPLEASGSIFDQG